MLKDFLHNEEKEFSKRVYDNAASTEVTFSSAKEALDWLRSHDAKLIAKVVETVEKHGDDWIKKAKIGTEEEALNSGYVLQGMRSVSSLLTSLQGDCQYCHKPHLVPEAACKEYVDHVALQG